MFERAFATYSFLPFGVNASPYGSTPTATVATFAGGLTLASITVIVFSPALATNTRLPSGETARLRGSLPTWISAILSFLSPATRVAVTLLASGLATHSVWSSGLSWIGPELLAPRARLGPAAAGLALPPLPPP